VNSALVTTSEGSPSAVVIHTVKETELDEMWSFVGSKQQPRWLWEALDHQTGRIVAYTLRYHVSPGRPWRYLSSLANDEPNFTHHCRTASLLTVPPLG
jgi:IS1 transposase